MNNKSAKSQRHMTTLEMEAANNVHDANSNFSDDVEVNDENKYEQLLESRKSRRAVSLLVILLNLSQRVNRCTISSKGKSKLKCARHLASR